MIVVVAGLQTHLFLLNISTNAARIDNLTWNGTASGQRRVVSQESSRASLFNLESGIPIRAGPVNVLRPFTGGANTTIENRFLITQSRLFLVMLPDIFSL